MMMKILKLDDYVDYTINYYKEHNPYYREFVLQIEYMSDISIESLKSYLNNVLDREFKSHIIGWLDYHFDITSYDRVENIEIKDVYKKGIYTIFTVIELSL
jgi:hypothetical protein